MAPIRDGLRGPCRHCGTVAIMYPRLLCWSCYHRKPGVRELYPVSVATGAARGLGMANAAPRVPERPTSHPAGTLAKMRVMRARLRRGEALFHPADNPEVVAEQPFLGTILDYETLRGPDPLE